MANIELYVRIMNLLKKSEWLRFQKHQVFKKHTGLNRIQENAVQFMIFIAYSKFDYVHVKGKCC